MATGDSVENIQMSLPLAAPTHSGFRFAVDWLRHYRQVSTQRFTVVDVETTGHTPKTSRIIEIALLQATLAEGIQREQSHLVNPGVMVPNRITRFTGISADMVRQAAAIATVLPDYWPPLHQGILTAHNLRFDYEFLQAEYQRLGKSLVRPAAAQLCTVQLARQLLADLPSRSLPQLVEHFQFPIATSHRAAADTRACWLLAQRLLTEVNTHDDDTLIARLGREWLPIQAIYQLFGRSRLATQQFLEELAVPTRSSRRRKAPMYRRADIERVYWETQSSSSET